MCAEEMDGDVKDGERWRGESESRFVVGGEGLVMTSRFTGIEPLYTSVKGYAALYRAQKDSNRTAGILLTWGLRTRRCMKT